MSDTRPIYEVLVAFTRTGEIVDSLPFTGWSWSDSIAWADPGKMSVTVPLTGPDAAGRSTVEALRAIRRAPWSLSLLLLRDQRPVWAGPAVTLGWNDSDVTVGCSSIAALFDRRMTIADPWYAQPIRYEGNIKLQLGTRDLVLELLRRGMTGARRDLPIDLPTQTGSAGPAVEYLAADLGTISERVKAAVERDDGPDVIIRPTLSLSTGRLRWAVDVGTPRLGSATSRATFDLAGGMRSLSGDIDASEAVSTGYVLGDSTGGSSYSPRLIGVAVVDRGDPHPALERADRTSVSERRQEQLDALARSYVQEFSMPTETWSMTVHPDHTPILGPEWTFGDVITASVTNHPWVEDGDYPRRVIAVDAQPDTLTLSTTDPV